MKKSSSFISIFAFLLIFASLTARSEEPNIQLALSNNDFKLLDTTLNGLQQSFEIGRLSEIQLRNAYRPFYKLDKQQQEALREWPRKSPSSYAAHLALGIFLKKAAQDARGDGFISETSQKQLTEMHRLNELSRAELRQSINLTKKPYLSVFHLLDIAKSEGDDEAMQKLLAQANKILPNNFLARARYLTSILPRWGGSYEQAQKYIQTASKEGLDAKGVMQLEAIVYNDKGDMAWRNRDHTAAKANFLKALDLANTVGGSFKKDFLESADSYICGKSKTHPMCK